MLVHLVESSKPEARAEGIRLIVLLEVPRLLEGRPRLARVAINNLSRDKAVHDKKIAGDFVLTSRFAEISRKREPNAAGPVIMFHEVATLVHLIESSKPEARAKGIRLIVLLEVP